VIAGRLDAVRLLSAFRAVCLDCGSMVKSEDVTAGPGDQWVIRYHCCGVTTEQAIRGISAARALASGDLVGELDRLIPQAVGHRPYPPGPEVP
jgi:hypothetical protein